jgi:hypothetical protein
MTIRFLPQSASRIFALAGSNTLKSGGRKQAGGFLAEGPLASHPYSEAFTVLTSWFHTTETMRSFAGNLRLQPRGRLNTSFTFVPTITNTTPRKNEMQAKFLPVQKKIYAAPTPPG